MQTATHNTTQQQTKFKETAIHIANYLAKEAIWDEDRCNWLGDTVEAVNNQYKVVRRSFANDFYNGTAGIAYFLAHLLKFHEDPILEETLAACVNQVLHLNEHADPLGSNYGLYGGRAGIGFALIEIGKLRNKEAWIKAGYKVLDKVAETEIGDYELDVIAGVAGGIPIFLKYYKETQDPKYLNAAIKGAQHLIQEADKTETSWGWKTHMTAHSITGYSHGNAGMALALLELYQIVQDPTYYAAAMYAFNYERLTYNPNVQNWPDLREVTPGADPSQMTYGLSWCHGAPGIALSRLRAWQLTGDNSFKQEAEIAFNTTYKSVYNMLSQQSTPANYSLCHGIAGNADILLFAVKDLDKPSYQQIANQVGEVGIARYDITGLSWPSGVNDPSNQTQGMGETPGLMLGLAGTGFFYLRLAFPGEIDSPLLVMPN